MASQSSIGSEGREAAEVLLSLREDRALVEGTSCNVDDLDVLQSMAEMLDDTAGGKRKKSRKGGRRGRTRVRRRGGGIKDKLRELVGYLCRGPREVYDSLKQQVDSEVGEKVKAVSEVDKGKIATSILKAVKGIVGTAGTFLVGRDLARGTSGVIGASVVGIVRAAILGVKLLPDPNIVPIVAGAFNTVSAVGGELASAIAADPQKYVALITAFLITKKVGDLKGALDKGELYKTVVNELMFVLLNDNTFYQTYIEGKDETDFKAYMEEARKAVRTKQATPAFPRGLVPLTDRLRAHPELPTESQDLEEPAPKKPRVEEKGDEEKEEKGEEEKGEEESGSEGGRRRLKKTAKGKGRRRTPKRINRRRNV
jgi:hypothetical protein